MRFIINNLQEIPLNEKFIIKVFNKINRHFKRKFANYELVITFVDDKYIRRLNRKFLGRNYATDVMAFPMDENFTPSNIRRMVLGDVIISVQRAKIQAKRFKNSFNNELALLVIHGTLHLLGYDDIKTKDALIMRKKEQNILGTLKNMV